MNASLLDDAITLAGALAEAGVQGVEFREADAGWRLHTARITDLPGLIAGSQAGAELRWPGGGAKVEQSGLRWWGAPGLPSHPA